MVLKNWRNSWMCRQKVHRWHLLWIWKVKERKYVALLRLLACVADGDHRKSDSTRIFCRIWIYRSSMNATSKYIARSPFRTKKITLIIRTESPRFFYSPLYIFPDLESWLKRTAKSRKASLKNIHSTKYKLTRIHHYLKCLSGNKNIKTQRQTK